MQKLRSLDHLKIVYKYQGPNSKDEKVTSLLSPFRDRKADILAERGNQKGSPRVYWTN